MITSTAKQVRSNRDIDLRINVIERRGMRFANPVTVFQAANGPGSFGARVAFQIYQLKGIATVEILRNTARDSGSASTLQSYPVSELTLNRPIVYYDHDKSILNKTAYYWVRVVPLHTKFAPIIEGPQIVAVPPYGDTSITAPNDPSNTGNFATVDSIDAGGSASIRIYGTGGVGSSWMRQTGYGPILTFPSGTITGQAYSTALYVFWTGPLATTPGAHYVAVASFAAGLNDNWSFAGKVTTVAAGGGGGVTGGGTGIGSVLGQKFN